MKLSLEREAKVYIDALSGVEIHILGYATALLLHAAALLKPGEEMPEGVISATGDGEIPGMRKQLVADALLTGYLVVERSADNPNVMTVTLSPIGERAALNHEVVGIKPPRPMSFLYRKMEQLIAESRVRRSNGRRKTA